MGRRDDAARDIRFVMGVGYAFVIVGALAAFVFGEWRYVVAGATALTTCGAYALGRSA